MAMFPTHIKASTIAGIAGGTAAHLCYGVPVVTSMVGAGLCAVGGILPDIDSGPGIPLREITTFLASVVPTMLITRLLSYKLDQEMLILVGASIYVGIRFGLSHFLRTYTVHRGMFHSFPSMAIFGELIYLLFYGESLFVRLFMVVAVCAGFFIHLLLDELYSVEWDGRPHIKKSFGTAMKFIGESWWANATCYGKLTVLTYFVLSDPNVVQQIYAGQGQQVAQNLGAVVKERLDTASVAVHTKTSASGPLATFLRGSTASPASGATAVSNSPAVAPPVASWPSTAKPAPANPATPNWSVPAAPRTTTPPAPTGQFWQ